MFFSPNFYIIYCFWDNCIKKRRKKEILPFTSLFHEGSVSISYLQAKKKLCIWETVQSKRGKKSLKTQNIKWTSLDTFEFFLTFNCCLWLRFIGLDKSSSNLIFFFCSPNRNIDINNGTLKLFLVKSRLFVLLQLSGMLNMKKTQLKVRRNIVYSENTAWFWTGKQPIVSPQVQRA